MSLVIYIYIYLHACIHTYIYIYIYTYLYIVLYKEIDSLIVFLYRAILRFAKARGGPLGRCLVFSAAVYGLHDIPVNRHISGPLGRCLVFSAAVYGLHDIPVNRHISGPLGRTIYKTFLLYDRVFRVAVLKCS